ncbi:hypothetical protein F4823DRAFT_133474 [Ustulina deusta]|nr:hypothetical protein F4823DRAFT_133474 [Ustulina deusta]
MGLGSEQVTVGTSMLHLSKPNLMRSSPFPPQPNIHASLPAVDTESQKSAQRCGAPLHRHCAAPVTAVLPVSPSHRQADSSPIRRAGRYCPVVSTCSSASLQHGALANNSGRFCTARATRVVGQVALVPIVCYSHCLRRRSAQHRIICHLPYSLPSCLLRIQLLCSADATDSCRAAHSLVSVLISLVPASETHCRRLPARHRANSTSRCSQ